MDEIFLPFLAGLRLLASNPFDCSGTQLFQIGTIGWALCLIARVAVGDVLARRTLGALCPLGASDIEASPYPDLLRAISGTVRIRIANATAPRLAVVGFFAPELVIDPGLLRTMSRSEVLAVLSHELAHIERKDAVATAVLASVCSQALLLAVISRILYSAFPAHLFRLTFSNAAVASVGVLVLAWAIFYGVEKLLKYHAELMCDQIACRRAGGQAVASALVRAARAPAMRTPSFGGSALAFIHGPSINLRVRRALRMTAKSRFDFARPAMAVALFLFAAGIVREIPILQESGSGQRIANCAACEVLWRDAQKRGVFSRH